jgi:aryl-alcohol dehydrogenase-like predicted oxidoreductase
LSITPDWDSKKGESKFFPPYQTLGQVAIRFALDQEGISTVIVGAKSAQQVKNNLKAASLPALESELRKRLIGTFHDLTDVFNTGE